MKSLILSICLCSSIFAVEIVPTNFDLRSLALLVSQECEKNIIVSQDIKNMSADYFLNTDVSPDVFFQSFKRLIESKGLFLNEYDNFFVVDEREYKAPIPQNHSNIELTMKVIEINNDLMNQKGFEAFLKSNTSLSLTSTDFKSFKFDKLFSLEYDGLLNALETNNYVKIMGEPYVVVANGKKTVLNVGDTTSVKTSALSQDSTLSTSVRSTYVQKDLGLTIEVTPVIQQDGIIFLNTKLTHEVLKKQNTDGLIDTTKKSINSDFYLKDGGSIAIGGLTLTQDVKSISKIPLLGDLPILDYFFAYENVKTIRNTLTIFIQVKVIK